MKGVHGLLVTKYNNFWGAFRHGEDRLQTALQVCTQVHVHVYKLPYKIEATLYVELCCNLYVSGPNVALGIFKAKESLVYKNSMKRVKSPHQMFSPGVLQVEGRVGPVV